MAEIRRVSHRVEPDGWVMLFHKDGTGRILSSLRISEHEAKVFAWALLSDIDPDELDATYAEPEDAAQKYQRQILDRLSKGAASSPEVADAIDLPVDEVGGRMMKLRNQGLVSKIASKGRAGSVWSLTAAGFGAWRNGSRPITESGRRTA